MSMAIISQIPIRYIGVSDIYYRLCASRWPQERTER